MEGAHISESLKTVAPQGTHPGGAADLRWGERANFAEPSNEVPWPTQRQSSFWGAIRFVALFLLSGSGSGQPGRPVAGVVRNKYPLDNVEPAARAAWDPIQVDSFKIRVPKTLKCVPPGHTK